MSSAKIFSPELDPTQFQAETREQTEARPDLGEQ